MTLRARLTGAFFVVLLGPLLVGGSLLAAALAAGATDPDRSQWALGRAIAVQCDHLQATADGLAVTAAARGEAMLVTPAAAPAPWTICGVPVAELPVAVDVEIRGLAARAPVSGPEGVVAGYAYAVRPVDDAFLATLAAAAGRPVTAAELAGQEPTTQPASPRGVGTALVLAVVGTALLLSGALAWWLAGLAMRPLTELMGTVDRAADGDLASRSRIPGRDETARLGRGLNRILGNLQETQRQSVTDALTGLGNLRHLRESMRRETERAIRFRRTLGVLALDLDHFKRINDRYGHRVGDDVLVEFARRVRTVVREVDLAFRQGGEEFVILLPETDVAGSLTAARRIGEAVRERPFFPAGVDSIPLTVSIGVAVFPRHAPTATEVLAAADEALYRAKALGRDTYAMAPTSDDEPSISPADGPATVPEQPTSVAYAGGASGGTPPTHAWAGG